MSHYTLVASDLTHTLSALKCAIDRLGVTAGVEVILATSIVQELVEIVREHHRKTTTEIEETTLSPSELNTILEFMAKTLTADEAIVMKLIR